MPRCGRSWSGSSSDGDIDPRHGARFRYANPLTGGPVMPTMGAHLALLPKGFKGKDYQATDSTIFVCVEGEGSTKVGDKVLEWGPKDVFVVPSWMKHSHNGQEGVGAVLDLRPAGAGSARHLAREGLTTLRLVTGWPGRDAPAALARRASPAMSRDCSASCNRRRTPAGRAPAVKR